MTAEKSSTDILDVMLHGDWANIPKPDNGLVLIGPAAWAEFQKALAEKK